MQSRSVTLFILFLAVIAALLGYNYFAQPFARNFPQQIVSVNDSQSDSAANGSETASSSAFSHLSQRQRLSQLIAAPLLVQPAAMATASAFKNADVASWVVAEKPGMIVLFGSQISSKSADVALTRLRLDLGADAVMPLIAVDHEGGVVQRLSGAGYTKLPTWRALCQQAASQSAQLHTQSAQELSTTGVQVVFAPVLDLAGAGGKSALGSRVCDDVAQLEPVASQFIETFARKGVLSVIKHFPGLGQLTTDPHFSAQAVVTAERDLEPFTRMLDLYTNIGVMTSHVAVEGFFDGTPCSLSAECLRTFPEKYPRVVLFTDALEMQPALDFAKTNIGEESSRSEQLAWLAKQALSAGNHVLVFGESVTALELTYVLDQLELEYAQNAEFAQIVEEQLLQVESLR